MVYPWPYIKGNVFAETRDVFSLFGIIIFVFALVQAWRTIEFPAVWYGSVLLFYIVAADTSGDGFAFYYHSSSIPPACLLMGFGFLGVQAGTGWTKSRSLSAKTHSIVAGSLLSLTLAATLARGCQLTLQTYGSEQLESMYQCSKNLSANVPSGSLIVARGGIRWDEHGHPVAFNEPMIFFWMDRKGFNYAHEDYSESMFRSLAQRGGRYWMASPKDRINSIVFAEISRKCILVARCGSFTLFDLSPLADARQDPKP